MISILDGEAVHMKIVIDLQCKQRAVPSGTSQRAVTINTYQIIDGRALSYPSINFI